MLLNEFNVFDMDLFMVNVSPDFPNGSNNNNDNNNNNKNCDNIGLTYNHNNLNTSSNFNGNCTNSTNTTTMDDGFMFDDKLIDFGQDLDTLSLSLWQSEGFNGINCEEPMKIEDIFQAGINDFTDGPTLAELNLVDDKLDSADLDEYLVNPPSMAADKDDVNGFENVKDTPNELKTNTLDGLAVFNNVNAPSSSVHLTSDEIEQLVSLAEPSNADPQDYDSVYANNQSQSSSASPCPSWEVKKDFQSSSLNEQQSLNSLPMPQKIFKQPKQRDVKPLTVDSKLSSSTNTDVLMNNNENVVNVSACPAMSIKQEPVSPEMDLDNLALSYNQNSCDVNEEKATKNEQIQINHPGPSPEYSKPQLRRRRNNSNSTDCSFSSHDEGFASQPEDNSDNDQENDDSDDESFYKDYDAKDLLGATTSEDAENKWALDMGRTRKTGQQRYFWQYNVQSKGPKGTRLVQLQDICNDPHVLMEAKDPVFSPDCSMEGVKHAGKARRGDGNDLTPNPKKLLMIGLELKKLSKIINELTPVAQVPVNSRNKSRKEKNKLASRACRLKKKAQHEANKIKLYGLQQEHKRMMNALIDIQHLANVVLEKGRSVYDGRLTDIYENIVASKGPKVKVAGDTTEFVNSILDNVSAGISDGGLDQL